MPAVLYSGGWFSSLRLLAQVPPEVNRGVAKGQRRVERPSLIQAQDSVPRANQPAPQQK